MTGIPTYDQYIAPTMRALQELGGSASNGELVESVSQAMGLTDEQMSVVHNAERGNQTEVAYRMAWARTYLKKAGFLENSARGVWALTPKGRANPVVDPQAVVRFVRGEYQSQRDEEGSADEEQLPDVDASGETDWRGVMLDTLHRMSPDAFERLAQRILRESGFVEVKVLGRSGDGGIDGTGILRLHSVVSFHVLFQCKRWVGSVSAREIRDFRGAMVGRTDKGLFITTGSFTRDARREATRDGAPPVDLIDGDQLVDLLKELGLGCEVRTVTREEVIVEPGWFESI